MDPFSPAGTDQFVAWVKHKGWPYQLWPDLTWYSSWEPFETIVAPSRYFNAVQVPIQGAHAVVVEPWNALGDITPLGRTLLAFVEHPGLFYRASCRTGGSYLTRVAYLDGSKPIRQFVGDPEWDDSIETFADSPLDAARALTPSLRKLLLSWHFEGHLEIRKGRLMLHVADVEPSAGDYSRLAAWLPTVLEKALKQRPGLPLRWQTRPSRVHSWWPVPLGLVLSARTCLFGAVHSRLNNLFCDKPYYRIPILVALTLCGDSCQRMGKTVPVPAPRPRRNY